jgi:hypothetical protein
VLRTNIADWSAETLWLTYIQLTEAEAAAFRIDKSQLSLRPICHQRADRFAGPLIGLFSRLRDVEDPGAVAEPGRLG